jgi:hypothetical protein
MRTLPARELITQQTHFFRQSIVAFIISNEHFADILDSHIKFPRAIRWHRTLKKLLHPEEVHSHGSGQCV